MFGVWRMTDTEYKPLLDNIPEGATHYRYQLGKICYYKVENKCVKSIEGDEWQYSHKYWESDGWLRSLTQIGQLTEVVK
jgi:hypothetical protein